MFSSRRYRDKWSADHCVFTERCNFPTNTVHSLGSSFKKNSKNASKWQLWRVKRKATKAFPQNKPRRHFNPLHLITCRISQMVGDSVPQGQHVWHQMLFTTKLIVVNVISANRIVSGIIWLLNIQESYSHLALNEPINASNVIICWYITIWNEAVQRLIFVCKTFQKWAQGESSFCVYVK